MEATLKPPRVELELIHRDKKGDILEIIKLDSEDVKHGNSSE